MYLIYIYSCTWNSEPARTLRMPLHKSTGPFVPEPKPTVRSRLIPSEMRLSVTGKG